MKMKTMQVKRKMGCVPIFLLAVYCFLPADAFATGGAYIYTKHGGGTTDGVAPYGGGVNRGANPDYSTGIYYDITVNPDAGQYQAGECSHCHEPHASFGGQGVEPPPVTGSPSKYLLMKYGESSTNYSELCWYCHENMTLNGQALGYGYYGFYQGKTNYQLSSHYNSANFSWPGATGGPGVGGTPDATATWPRSSRGTTPCTATQGNCGSCLNCHTPHGVKGSFDTGAAPSSTNYSAATTAYTGVIPRQLISREEALCLNCHDSGGPATAGGAFGAGTSVKDEVDKYLYITGASATEGSGHPVRNTNYYGLHDLAGRDKSASTTGNNETSTAASGWLGTTSAESPHAECVDCHNPHMVQGYGSGDATRGVVFQRSGGAVAYNTNRGGTDTTSNPVNIGKANIGVWGVNVTTSTGVISSNITSLAFATSPPTNYMYQLCLKCHSAWAWGAATGTASPWNSPSTTKTYTGVWMPSNYKMTDVADEFKTGNNGYHPVFGQGLNTPEAASVRNPNWCNEGTATYGTTCTRKAGNRADLTSASPFANANQTLSQTFVPPWNHKSYITCTDCHEDNSETSARGPHGSAKPFILRQSDASISYTICTNAGCTTTTSVSYATVPGTTPNFCLNCHRVDVYSCMGCYGASHVATYANFSRQSHPPDPGQNSFDTNPNGNPPPRGITCLFCHGGGLKSDGTTKLGTIHGSNEGVGAGGGTSVRGKRLLTGVAWDGVTRGTTATAGTCFFAPSGAGTLNGCTQHANTFTGAFNAVANYTYDAP